MKSVIFLTTILFTCNLQNPRHFLPGGTHASATLVEPITQIMAKIQKIAAPVNRGMLSIMNGVFGLIKHHDQEEFKLANTSGDSISRKSTLKVIENFTSGKNKVCHQSNFIHSLHTFKQSQGVLKWSKDVEVMWFTHPESKSSRWALALIAPGFTLVIDNIGWVSEIIHGFDHAHTISPQFISSRHMDKKHKKSGYVQVFAVVFYPQSHHQWVLMIFSSRPLKPLLS